MVQDEITNELRADFGSMAVDAATQETGAWENDHAIEGITDTVAYVLHLADRCGIAPEEVLERGLRTYSGDLNDGPRARQIYTRRTILAEGVEPENL